NTIATPGVASTFTVSNATAEWTNPNGGLWDDPGNWETGVVPGATDDVLVNLSAGATVTYRSGDMRVGSLHVTGGSLVLSGGSLTVTGDLTVDGSLSLQGGTLARAKVGGTGSASVTAGATLDAV